MTNMTITIITVAITTGDNEITVSLMTDRSGNRSNLDTMIVVLVVDVGETCDTVLVSVCIVDVAISAEYGSSVVVNVLGTMRRKELIFNGHNV